MKKVILGIVLLFTVTAVAQSYQQGQVDLNLGIGIGNSFAGASPYRYRSTPMLNASGEYGITDAIGVGAFVGYTSVTYRYANSWYNNGGWHSYYDDYKWSFFIIGLRGAYHFDEFVKIDKLDLYAGLMLGYNVAKYTYTSTDANHPYVNYYGSSYGGFAWSVYGGARYRFSEKMGVFGEFGYGLSYMNIGVTLKIK